ncbi:MAG: BON domain-containing protein [Acidobacteriota bacterium]|nr:BON domain-containing protein [Acidobacteriota bacterium]
MILSIYGLRFALVAILLLTAAACGGTRVGVNTGVTASDFTATELIARIKTVLLNDAVVGLRRIDVHAIDGAITLTGRVASKEEEDRALSLTRGVEGVRSVKSELAIQP